MVSNYLSSKQRNKAQHALNGNGFFGNLIGQGLGALGSKLFPIAGVDGATLGGSLGGMLPFARGGVIPVPVNRMGAYKKGGKIQRTKKAKKSTRRK
jgi:hypothetical protein